MSLPTELSSRGQPCSNY